MSIRLTTLGAPQCVRDGSVLADLPTQRLRFALLVYLAVERNVARDDAAALFWAESGEERARHTLSQTIYELRRLFGETWLQTQGGRLVVTDELSIDAEEFIRHCEQQQFESAVALYQGPFLSGFFLSNSKGFETWVDRQRSHLERVHRRARRECVNALLAQNRMSAALEIARQWVALDPFEDEANHRLIELLALSGARADALREYDSYEKRLRDELSLEPLDHTKELIQRLRTDQPPAFKPFVPAPVEAKLDAPSSAKRRRFSPVNVGLPLAVLIGFASVWWLAMKPSARARADMQLDTTRFALLPFDYGSNSDVKLDEQQLLREAFNRWSGATIADPFQVREALKGLAAPLRPVDARKAARQVGAGRYVLGTVTRFGDSLRVYGVLYSTVDGQPLADRTLHLPVALVGADSMFEALADALLYGNEVFAAGVDPLFATHSWPARRAFNRAQSAIREWNLAGADTALMMATKQDPDYAEAYLWLAQVRSWQRRDPSEWLYAVQRASGGKARLTPREQTWTDALIAFARGDLPAACGTYEKLVHADERDFGAWYGWGDCLRRDFYVYADRASPTGYYFRSSYRQALSAFEQAFLIMPSLLRAFRAAGYQETRNLFWTNASRPRAGRAADRTDIGFVAYPTMNTDTLAFFPMPFADLMKAWPWARDHHVYDALQYQRREFLRVAQAWAAAFPEDPDAKEALAVSLELLGDNTALDTLQRARQLTHTTAEAVRLAASEVWLLIKYSAPFDANGLRYAAALADTVLNDPSALTSVDRHALVSLAVLRGRADQAARLAQNPSLLADLGLSRARAAAAQRLLVYAALAAPKHTLDQVQAELDAIGSVQTGDDAAWRTVEERAATLVYPSDGVWLNRSKNVGNQLLRAQLAATEHRFGEVKKWVIDTRALRTGMNPADVTFDAVYPEAALIHQVYGGTAAAAWLDPHLDALRFSAPEVFLDYTRSASLIRAMALRAQIAAQSHDVRRTRQYATAVSILWSDADPFLQPTVARMNALARGKF